MANVRFALYLAVGLAIGLVVREYVRALGADKLGDPSPRRWGRLTLNPRSMVDPFGTLLLPGLILILWAAGSAFRPPPFAYAKPVAFDPHHLRHPKRDTVLIAVAGPVANLVLAVFGGLLLRVDVSREVNLFAYGFLYANVVMAVFHLMPIPGLDGARIVALVLPPRAREVYTNLDHYLPLFMLVIFFLLAAPLLSIVNALADVGCRALAGISCPA